MKTITAVAIGLVCGFVLGSLVSKSTGRYHVINHASMLVRVDTATGQTCYSTGGNWIRVKEPEAK